MEHGIREDWESRLAALALHLPRYQRSLANYAHDLTESGPAPLADSAP